MRKILLNLMIIFFMMCLVVSISNAPAVDKKIILPAPKTDGGKPLMVALKERKSEREFSNKKLPLDMLSNLLWAANGINRSDSGKRTAPSAMGWQEVDVYLVLEEGLYLYNAKKHILELIAAKDLRALAGKQPFVKDAPLNLIYVADHSRMGNAAKEDKDFYSFADTGFISENVYLFCASEGLATVVRAWIDKAALAKEMDLKASQIIILAQTVGFPK
jgi:SagB-type dehydrogenase family enzyme